MESKTVTNAFQETLNPLKLIIHGPPASGKTTIVRRICKRYGAHYVSEKSMIEETLEELRMNIINAKEHATLKSAASPKDIGDGDEEVEEEEELEDEEQGRDMQQDLETEIRGYQEQIHEINSLLSNDGRLPDDYLVRLMRDFLAKPLCQNHGYVLDDFPKTLLQAKELFGQAAEVPKEPGEGQLQERRAEEIAGGEGAARIGDIPLGNASISIIPDFVISLQADDEFLCERLMKISEEDIKNVLDYEEKLIEFRTNNTPDESVLNFFDEAGIHPILIDIAEESIAGDSECILSYLYKIFGPPISGIGLTDEEEEELRKMEMEQRRLKQEAYLINKQLAEDRARQEYENKMEVWAATFEKLQMEEEKILAADSEPLRFYLMKYVFPTLTLGLCEVAKIKPDDPIDYLAEFLFKENPEGKMFDPSYTRNGEELTKATENIS
ncbi:hypothetical protein ABEB36_006541 [Hypothenemus hampei]|uniref:Adenylate kinase 7 n=1 Tax=Hypothenemus hampei TaxID=57062 RepID=A0ABD1EQV3_HYPHA